MTPDRGSTYTSVMGGLSLIIVALALYLSPVGGSLPMHAKVDSAVRAVAATTSGEAKHEAVDKVPTTTTSTTPPKPKTVARTTPSQQIVKEVVYLPAATASGPSEVSSTTTTSAPRSATNVATFTVQTKPGLIAPNTDYWGVSINGVPQGSAQLNALDTEVGEAPSELTWYDGWDQPYPAQTVQSSWEHGALPMITWESKPSVDLTPAQSDPAYALRNIIGGNFDSYLQTFAQSVATTGLPVVIRMDQEMNGNWFPWSEGVNGNTPGQFAQMWQHVWNIFQAAGANRYVIWLWAPNRVDNLSHSAPALSELYPGDAYVDWIGVDAYWRYTSEAPTFAAVFGKTMADLEALTTKPVYIAETSGIETDPTTGVDVGAQKVQFTTNLISGIEADTRIVGFSWFDNVATSNEDNVPVTNDWRLDSDPANLLAFKLGLASGPFSNGLMPTSGTPAQLAVVSSGGG